MTNEMSEDWSGTSLQLTNGGAKANGQLSVI